MQNVDPNAETPEIAEEDTDLDQEAHDAEQADTTPEQLVRLAKELMRSKKLRRTP